MVRVVEKEGVLGAGGGGIAAAAWTPSKKIMRRYPGRGSVYYSGGFRY